MAFILQEQWHAAQRQTPIRIPREYLSGATTRLVATFATIAIHGALFVLIILRLFGVDLPARAEKLWAGPVMIDIGTSVGAVAGVPVSRASPAPATAEPAVSEPLMQAEWRTTLIYVPQQVSARYVAPSRSLPSTLANAPGVTGGGQYDPYAGAAPSPELTAGRAPSAGDQSLNGFIARIRGRHPEDRGTATFRVRLAGNIILQATYVGGSLSPATASRFMADLIGTSLDTPDKSLSDHWVQIGPIYFG